MESKHVICLATIADAASIVSNNLKMAKVRCYAGAFLQRVGLRARSAALHMRLRAVHLRMLF